MMEEYPQGEEHWIFVSHSHKDLEKVRRIRNALEEKGHNPLLFFLKCLDDESELDDLIRREIETRTWFILCDSPNSRASRWVQEEVEIIKSLDGKVYTVVDLDSDFDVQLEEVTGLSKRATVFLSYAREDSDVAGALSVALREHEFRVFDVAQDLRPGGTWQAQTKTMIEEAVRRGFFLLLLSPESISSVFVKWEVLKAFQRSHGHIGKGNIVPIIVKDRDRTLEMLSKEPGIGYLIAPIDFFDLTEGQRGERIAELVRLLKTREME